MILQALNRYYERLLDDEDSEVSPLGFGEARISYVLVLDRGGHLVDLQEWLDENGKPRPEPAPKEVVRSGTAVRPNFLWDNASYVLGIKGVDEDKNIELSPERFEAFHGMAHELGRSIEYKGVEAVLAFLDNWAPERDADLSLAEQVAGKNLAFRLEGEKRLVHQHDQVKDTWLDHWLKTESGAEGQCLVTGTEAALSRLHPVLTGVWGTNQNRGRLVSFDKDAFTSYGKTQNYNAPVSTKAAFAYTTALNQLLASGSKQRIQIGDASVVFWSEEESPVEEILGMAINGNPAQDEALNQRVEAFLRAAKQGVPSAELKPDNPFYILGLSPSAGRITVRFWHKSTEGDIKDRLGEHLKDLEIARQYDSDPENPNLRSLLFAIVPVSKRDTPEDKRKKIPPQLAGELTRAVLTGSPYPLSLLAAVIRRVRADRELSYIRASMIKAILNRRRRKSRSAAYSSQSMEVTVSLDPDCNIPAYRLGRLFAILEDLQRAALGPKINATIRDKYLSSASGAPRANFPFLLRNAQNHYSKLRKDPQRGGLAGFFENKIQEIMGGLEVATGLPTTLDMEQQGLFFLGYYHQKAHRPAKVEEEIEQAAQAEEVTED